MPSRIKTNEQQEHNAEAELTRHAPSEIIEEEKGEPMPALLLMALLQFLCNFHYSLGNIMYNADEDHLPWL
jgi:hypothetical protein